MGLSIALKKSLEFFGVLSTADEYFRRDKFSNGFERLEMSAREQTARLVRNETPIKEKYGEEIYGSLLVLFRLQEQLYAGLSRASLYFEANQYEAMDNEIARVSDVFDRIHDAFVTLEGEERKLLRENGSMPTPRTYEEREHDVVTIQGSADYINILKREILSIPEGVRKQPTQKDKNIVFSNMTILVRHSINNKILSDYVELKARI